MYYCGIDWGIDKLDLCVIDSNEEKVVTFTIENNTKGYIEALSILEELEYYPLIQFGIETQHQHIVQFLMQKGFLVFEIPPNCIYEVRKSVSISGCRSDSVDAFLIARYLKSHSNFFIKPIQKDSFATEQIRILSTDRDSLVCEASRLSNQLTACLRSYFPQMLYCFSDITCSTALDLLEVYPTKEELEKISDTDLENFLKSHKCYSSKRFNQIKDAMKEEIAIEKVVIVSKKQLMLALVRQLRVVKQEIERYDKKIAELLDKHQDYQWIQSLPGVGNTLSCKIIKHFGDNRNRFSCSNDTQALSGTAPVTVQSGKYRAVRFRKACNKEFRDTMQMIAFCSIRESQWANIYYNRKRDEGKSHSHALRCLANIWVKIIYTLWKKRECYSEEKRMADIGRHAYSNKS